MKKRLIKLVLCSAVVLNSTSGVFAMQDENVFMNIYVSQSGNDLNSGSETSPVKTIEAAQKIVRANNEKMNGDIVVNILPGTYYLDDTIEFSNEDGGKNGYNVIYKGEGKAALSGGRIINGFKKSETHPALIEADIPDADMVREFYVNGDKKRVARSETYFNPTNYKAEGSQNSSDGIYVGREFVQSYQNVEDVQFVWNRGWVYSFWNPTEIKEDPKNKNRMIVKFKNPEWNKTAEAAGATSASPNVTCYVQNALELLDSPGEFYFDKKAKKLYYMCEENENTSSEFVIPEMETGIVIMGRDISDKVKNITFDGIKFENFTSLYSIEGRGSSGQGPAYNVSSNGHTINNDFGTIYVNRAENINFTNNEFTGLGQAAINLKDAVSDSLIEGNVFYDLSGSGIEIGDQYHIEFDFGPDDARSKETRFQVNYYVEENPSTDFNMQLLQPYIFSSEPAQNKYLSMLKGTLINQGFNRYPHDSFFTTSVEDFKNYDKYGNSLTWRSSEEKIKAGEVPYVMYDFVKKYTFSEIVLGFKEGEVTDEEKTGYEILLSNDKDFSEYVTVAVQNTPAGEIERYKVEEEGKYRYMMVRALSAKPLAITCIYPFTADLPNQIIREMPENITIKNNYFTRIADTDTAQMPIFVFACDKLNILNNEISELPYSGISVGANWGFYGKCGRFNISNNYIHDTNKLNYDGGAIYSLGNHLGKDMAGSDIKNNYIKNTNGGVGIYLDNGTNTVRVTENVDEFTRYTITQNSGAVNNVINGGYSSRVYKDIWDAITINKDIEEFVIGDEPKEVQEIKSSAGIEDEYLHIKEKVSDKPAVMTSYNGFSSNCSITTHRHPVYHEGIIYALKNMSGVAGLDSESQKLLATVNDYSTATAKNSAAAWSIAKTVTEKLEKMSYSELLTEAKSALESINPDTATAEKGKQIVNAKFYNALKEAVDKGSAQEISYDDLNKAYENVMNNLNLPELKAVYVNGEKCTIDEDAHKVYTYGSEPVETDMITVEVADNTVFAGGLNTLKPGVKQTFAICSKNAKKYEYWTIEMLERKEQGISGELICYDGDIDGKIMASGDDGISFLPLNNHYSYYLDGSVSCDKVNTFKFRVLNSNYNNKASFILGASELEGFVPGSTDEKYNRIELEAYNKILRAWSVSGGSKKLIADKICDINYDGINTIDYKFEFAGNNTVVNLTVNGEKFQITAPGKISGDKFGFYSQTNTVTLY